MSVPNVKLSNGRSMPIIGLGTWKSKTGEVKYAVKQAIDLGYRHIDCALAYGNEKEVGEAISEAISSGKVSREELFVTSKCWNTYHKRERVVECCKKSLNSLGLEYLDLYLIHWPFSYKEGDVLFPRDEEEKIIFGDEDYLNTWKGMEDCHKTGLTKSIGLSNFNSEQIDSVIKEAVVKPVVLQVECHPYLNQKELLTFCKERGIALTAYSPLGSPDRPMGKPDDPSLIDDPRVLCIADKYKKSSAQVLIKFQVQRGVIVIPKSVNKERIAANLDVLDFELSPDDLEVLGSFEKCRFLNLDWIKEHPYYPFHISF